jgi:hypothetical protein
MSMKYLAAVAVSCLLLMGSCTHMHADDKPAIEKKEAVPDVTAQKYIGKVNAKEFNGHPPRTCLIIKVEIVYELDPKTAEVQREVKLKVQFFEKPLDDFTEADFDELLEVQKKT